MIIKLSPIRSDDKLTVLKYGDSISLNGITFDYSQLPDGATLPAEAIGIKENIYPVERINGVLHITIRMPHAADAPYDARFPSDIVNPADGYIKIPGIDGFEDYPMITGVIDWSQVITKEMKESEIDRQWEASVKAELAQRRRIADSTTSTLQDAVDMGIATPEEEALLPIWKKYRIELMRVPTQAGYFKEIVWPEQPGKP